VTANAKLLVMHYPNEQKKKVVSSFLMQHYVTLNFKNFSRIFHDHH